jgi:ribosome maturation factor RimP
MDLQKLQSPIERQLALLGFELVCLESAKEGRDSILRLYVDHLTQDRAVTLDDCVSVNDGLVAWMDVEFPSLREEVGLEISSPGLDRPLTKPEHYHRFAGRLCRIQTRIPINGQKRFKGWIGEATADAVTLEEDGILKLVPLDAIQRARLAPFDENGAPPPKHVQRIHDDPEQLCDQEKSLSPEGEEEKTPKPRLVAVAAAHNPAGVEKSAD